MNVCACVCLSVPQNISLHEDNALGTEAAIATAFGSSAATADIAALVDAAFLARDLVSRGPCTDGVGT